MKGEMKMKFFEVTVNGNKYHVAAPSIEPVTNWATKDGDVPGAEIRLIYDNITVLPKPWFHKDCFSFVYPPVS